MADEGRVSFGHTPLPDEQREALKQGRRLEWISLGVLVVTISLVMLVMGSSQAMKAAWIEDGLSFLPPIAFLVGAKIAGRRPSRSHPWGWHRSVGAGHLTASIALLAMGLFLVVDSGMTLIKQEHPTISTMRVFGHAIWGGWLMIAVMIVTSIPMVILGRMKLKVAEKLHDKVLFADADMNKADWQTGLGTVLGLLGVGVGWWWADSVVAVLIGLSIVHDGWSNLSHAMGGLLDAEARTHDDKEVHPAVAEVEKRLKTLPWVQDARARVRDQGHLFHAEAFVVPSGPWTLRDLEVATDLARDADWKLRDLVVVPVSDLPDDLVPAK